MLDKIVANRLHRWVGCTYLPVCVQPSIPCMHMASELLAFLTNMLFRACRRVYVCSDNLVPCGVVTLTDILHKLVDA